MKKILAIKNIVKHYKISVGNTFRRKYKICKAVDDVSFDVDSGGCVGIAGESGSGKTTIMKLILRIENETSGEIFFKGKQIKNLTRKDLKWYRSQVQAVFQDAASSLSPKMRINEIIGEPLIVHKKRSVSRKEIKKETEKILERVGLSSSVTRRYPIELSGGQKQRVAIARAVILKPSLVLLDEPTSALDICVRGQILNVLMDLQEEYNLTYIIISHDIAMLRNMSKNMVLVHHGKIIENGDTSKICYEPRHPYTKSVINMEPNPIRAYIKKK